MSCHISFISCMYSIITTIVSTVLHVYTFVPSKVHVYICKTLYARKQIPSIDTFKVRKYLRVINLLSKVRKYNLTHVYLLTENTSVRVQLYTYTYTYNKVVNKFWIKMLIFATYLEGTVHVRYLLYVASYFRKQILYVLCRVQTSRLPSYILSYFRTFESTLKYESTKVTYNVYVLYVYNCTQLHTHMINYVRVKQLFMILNIYGDNNLLPERKYLYCTSVRTFKLRSIIKNRYFRTQLRSTYSISADSIALRSATQRYAPGATVAIALLALQWRYRPVGRLQACWPGCVRASYSALERYSARALLALHGATWRQKALKGASTALQYSLGVSPGSYSIASALERQSASQSATWRQKALEGAKRRQYGATVIDSFFAHYPTCHLKLFLTRFQKFYL